ncbi:putative cell division-related metallo peptidase [Burkholderia contaminans]|nr:putative cell division-related metallo peptidase [Burkholderia contaminans]
MRRGMVGQGRPGSRRSADRRLTRAILRLNPPTPCDESPINYTGLVIVIGFVVLVAAQLLMSRQPTTSIGYSDFHRLVEAKLVDDLEIDQSSVSGVLRMPEAGAMLPAPDAVAVKKTGPPWGFTTNRVTDDHLVDGIDGFRHSLRGMPEAAWIGTLVSWALSVIAFVLIWNIMIRRLGGVRDLSGMGKSQARVYVQQETGITFDDIAGIDEVKAELQQIVTFLREPERRQRLGGKIPTGALIVGSPRTGKTLLARGGRRGGRNILFDQRLGVRRDVRRRRRRVCARSVRTGAAEGAMHRVHRRSRCARQGTRRRRDVGERRARADAEPAARRDGRLPGEFWRDHHCRGQPARDPRPGAAAAGPQTVKSRSTGRT